MKTRILLITLSVVALMSFGAARVIKDNQTTPEQANSTQIANSPIGGLEAEDK